MSERPRLSSTWFDGRSPRAQVCELRIESHELVLRVEADERRYPLRLVRWAERRSHGQRQSALPDGSLIQHAAAGEWDAWCQASGQRDTRVVAWMQSWRATLMAMVTTLVFMVVAWTWGVPWLSQALAQQVPRSLELRLGQQGLQQLERLFLEPSALSTQQQEALRDRFKSAVARAHQKGQLPDWQLSFHRSKALKANAFALPGGYIVITDDLVNLLADQPDAIVGVLAHELGHVQHRHGLDLMVRASLVSALLGLVLGDASGFLATVPVTLATQAYSRDAERAADAFAADLLAQSGVSPSAMVVFFERIRQGDKPAGAAVEGDRGQRLPIAISSHPDVDERIRFFRQWRAEPARP